MRTVTKSLSSAQRACLPNGKSVLGTLLVLAEIAALPVVDRAQTTPQTTPQIHHADPARDCDLR
jgi:hypothetical protein